MTSTLVLLPYPTDVGFAISSLERLFFEAALELADGDADRVHFLYQAAPREPPALPAYFKNYSALDLHGNPPRALSTLASFVAMKRIDVAITLDMQPVHPICRALHKGGVRTIISYWGAPISGPTPRWKLLLKQAQIRLSRSRVDGLVFESNAMAALAVNGRGVPRSMIDVIPLGVDVQRFRPNPTDYAHVAFNFPRSRRLVVFTGHCSPRKGIAILVEAAIEILHRRKREDVAFLICGNRGDESRPYESMYEKLAIVPWIRFAGYRPDVLEILQSCYCGVLPSTGWDSYTMSSVEMAATGLPVVASRLQGLEEAVLDRETGLLFEPGNAIELADCIERLLDDPDLARQLGSRGRLRCETELSLDVQRSKFVRAVRSRL